VTRDPNQIASLYRPYRHLGSPNLFSAGSFAVPGLRTRLNLCRLYDFRDDFGSPGYVLVTVTSDLIAAEVVQV
jgi:hypothetical protein